MTQPRVSRQQAEMLDKLGMKNATNIHPTLDEAARWLRDVKGWHVCVIWSDIDEWYCDIQNPSEFEELGCFPTHDLALSAGIDLILERLNNINN